MLMIYFNKKIMKYNKINRIIPKRAHVDYAHPMLFA
jgi:hypothetical protein